MALDKHELERLVAHASAGKVRGDRRCTGCGYSLHGLPLGGRCPECGLPIHAPPSIDAPLSQMPRPVIVRFTRASWLATACVALLVLLVASTYILDLGLQIRVGFVVVALAWFGVAWELTPAIESAEAISRGFSSRGRLRRAARVLQLGWIVAAVAYLLLRALPAAKLTGPLAELLATARMSGIAVGLGGAIALGILLGRLAEWARDGEAERAFNMVVWAVAITTILLFFAPAMLILRIILLLAWSTAVCTFPYALLSLTKSLTWSIRHSGEYNERARRQRDRAEEYQQEVGTTIERMDAAREHGRT